MREQATTKRQTTHTQPVRDADRNDHFTGGGTESPPEDVLLPTLDPGLTVLDIEGGRGVKVIQSLVLDHLLMNPGPAFWIDAEGHATTTSLARLAPSRRLLENIQIARGFTAYQHYSLCSDLPNAVNRSMQAASREGVDPLSRSDAEAADSPITPSIIVAPAVDAHYRDEDSLPTAHGETLLARVLARLYRYAEGYDVPVLLTRTADDAFTDAIDRVATSQLQCELTGMGPKFEGEDFETLLYPVEDGLYQTTWAYWQQVLQQRAEQVGLQVAPDTPTPGAPATDPAPTPRPLLDTLAPTLGGR